jgi:hypothetical protein
MKALRAQRVSRHGPARAHTERASAPVLVLCDTKRVENDGHLLHLGEVVRHALPQIPHDFLELLHALLAVDLG